MTIKELINELSKMNSEAKVLMLVCDGIEDHEGDIASVLEDPYDKEHVILAS